MTPADRAQYETTLDPNRATHVGIWRDEHDPISRHFYRYDVPELSDVVSSALAAGVHSHVAGIGPANTSDLLEPGYLPVETGMALSPDGELSVAVLTRFPGATPAMIDWWFGWHGDVTERYKLWHPQAHLFAQSRYALSDVDGLTDRERYVGNTSWVDEYVGPFPTRLAISFHDPGHIGLSYDDLEASGHGTAIYATVADSDTGEQLSSLLHLVRRTPWGSEMRSRFILPEETPGFVAAALLDHCYTEMTHLGMFLPRLYTHVLAGPDW